MWCVWYLAAITSLVTMASVPLVSESKSTTFTFTSTVPSTIEITRDCEKTQSGERVQETIVQETTGQEITVQVSTGQECTGQESTGQESTGQESTEHESTEHESTEHESTGHESTEHESTEHESTGHESTGQESTEYESTEHESTEHESKEHESTSADIETRNENGGHQTQTEETDIKNLHEDTDSVKQGGITNTNINNIAVTDTDLEDSPSTLMEVGDTECGSLSDKPIITETTTPAMFTFTSQIESQLMPPVWPDSSTEKNTHDFAHTEEDTLSERVLNSGSPELRSVWPDSSTVSEKYTHDFAHTEEDALSERVLNSGSPELLSVWPDSSTEKNTHDFAHIEEDTSERYVDSRSPELLSTSDPSENMNDLGVLDQESNGHTPQPPSTVSQPVHAIVRMAASRSVQSTDNPKDSTMDEVLTTQNSPLACYGDYLTPVTIERFCGGDAWSCIGKCGQFRNVPCSCDANCAIYQTCCLDYGRFCSVSICRGRVDPIPAQTAADAISLSPLLDNLHRAKRLASVASDIMQTLTDNSGTNTQANTSAHVAAVSAGESSTSSLGPKVKFQTTSPFDISAPREVGVSTESDVEGYGEETVRSQDVVTGQVPVLLGPYVHNIAADTRQPSSTASYFTSRPVSNESPTFGTSDITPPGNTTTQEGDDAPLQVPHARCNPVIRARVIDYCPNNTPPESLRRKACEARNPEDLIWMIPVTDTNTGLHFRNRHCHSCWRDYLKRVDMEKKRCSGQDVEAGVAFIHRRWDAVLFMSFNSRPQRQESLADIVQFMVENPSAVTWKSPEGFPYHPCKSDASVHECSACENSVVVQELSQLCRDSFSYVQVQGKMYRNKFCALCDKVSQLVLQQHSSDMEQISIDTVSDTLESLQCVVPLLERVEQKMHNFGFSATMHWSDSKETWLIENTATDDDGKSFTIPAAGQMAWKTLECDSISCTTVSCAHYAWKQDDKCSVPVTTMLVLCLKTSFISKSCSSKFSRFVDMDEEPFLRQLQGLGLATVLSVSPALEGLRAEDVEPSVEILDNKIYLTFWSAWHRKRDFLDPEFTPNVTALTSVLSVKIKQQLGFSGWMQVCIIPSLYRKTPKRMQGKTVFRCGNAFIRQPVSVVADMSSGTNTCCCCYRPPCGIVLGLSMLKLVFARFMQNHILCYIIIVFFKPN